MLNKDACLLIYHYKSYIIVRKQEKNKVVITINIRNIAGDLIKRSNSVVVKYKLLTMFSLNEEVDETLLSLREKVNKSKWVEDILKEQNDNGGFGRFHSQDTKKKQKYKTTEVAVLYLKKLGLRRGDLPIDRVCDYMEALIAKQIPWPDAYEHNQWFTEGINQFIASKLSLFGCDTQPYHEVVGTWINILAEALSDKDYSDNKTNEISLRHIGVPIHGSYIDLSSINAIILLAHNIDRIPTELQRKFLGYLHGYNGEIFYLNTNLTKPPSEIIRDTEMTSWLQLMGYLSMFKGFGEVFYNEISWLESRCGKDGLWDFNKALSSHKLSDNWRKPVNRKIDQTVYVLEILKNAYSQ